MAGTGLSEQQKLSSVLLLSGFVRNEATLTADIAAASGGAAVMPGYGAMLVQAHGSTAVPGAARGGRLGCAR